MLMQMQQAMRALQEENASLRHRLDQQQQQQQPPPQPPPQPSPPSSQRHEPQPSRDLQDTSGAGGAGARLASSAHTRGDATGGGGSRGSNIEPGESASSRKPGLAALRAVDHSELDSMRRELATLRTANEELRRSNEGLLRENAQLHTKLERLELVFESDAR